MLVFLNCVCYNEDFNTSRITISRYILCLRFWMVFVINEDFVKSNFVISRFCSIYFILILDGPKKIQGHPTRI